MFIVELLFNFITWMKADSQRGWQDKIQHRPLERSQSRIWKPTCLDGENMKPRADSLASSTFTFRCCRMFPQMAERGFAYGETGMLSEFSLVFINIMFDYLPSLKKLHSIHFLDARLQSDAGGFSYMSNHCHSRLHTLQSARCCDVESMGWGSPQTMTSARERFPQQSHSHNQFESLSWAVSWTHPVKNPNDVTVK